MSGFLGSHILEAALGLATVYLLLALCCSTINEWIATVLHSRAANLRMSLEALLAGQADFPATFLAHPLVAGLSKSGAPIAHLPPQVFSNALIDLVTPGVHGAIVFEDLKAGILNLPEGGVRSALLALLQNTDSDLHKAQVNIEAWFNDAMDRASAWYKRRAQYINIALSTAVTLALNADTLGVLRGLHTQAPSLLPGWDRIPVTPAQWLASISGWALTISAVSLGAPFWFDIVKRFAPAATRIDTPSRV